MPLPLLAVTASAIAGFFSKVVVNVDIIALGRSIARVAVVSGMVVLIVSASVIFVNTLTIILNIIQQFSHDSSLLLSNPHSDLSCLYYFLDALGITVIFNSFLSAFVGLILVWSGFKLQIILVRFSLTMTGTALKVL